MMIWHNILHSYYHSDCKSVDDKEALWSYEREEGKTQTQERFIGPIRESQLARGSILHNFFAFTTQTFGFFRIFPGCIFRLTCSHPELTEDHVLTSAYVKFFRTVTRNAVNKSV